MTEPAAVVAYTPDLMDRSRLSSAVPGVRFAARPGDLVAAAAEAGPHAAVVVDLTRPGVLAVLPELAAAGVRTIGYAGHLERELLAAAADAGCSTVVARSELFRRPAAVIRPS